MLKAAAAAELARGSQRLSALLLLAALLLLYFCFTAELAGGSQRLCGGAGRENVAA